MAAGTGATADRPHWRRRAALVFGSLLFALLLVGALEVFLRVAGIGNRAPWSASRLEYQHYTPPLLQPARRPDGTAVLRTLDPRLPFQSVALEKPANGLRVFCFGGSATAGLGLSPNATFARALEDMLRAALPERQVEVVNLGIVAFSSAQVRWMVDEACARYEPDLVVVYSGNNEFLEIHAEKYFALHGSLATRARNLLADTNLYRLLLGLSGSRAPTSVSEAAEEEMRLTEAELTEDINMSAGDMSAVLGGYEANVDSMATSAVERDVPILLMTVAANWRWRGRSDLPPGWLQELTGDAGSEPATDALRRRGVDLLGERLEDPGSPGGHTDLFRRAVLHEALGDTDAARSDYRAAMNVDPHLRRALDSMNERVAAVAEQRGVPCLDTVERLSAAAEGGIVGFDEFYDYVHFTPRGCLLVAAGIFEHMHGIGLVPEEVAFDPGAFVRTRLEELASRDEDYLEQGRWLGFCDDPSMLADRDLWKYDKMLARLDERIAADAGDFLALVWRGNALAFLPDGAARAAADYRAALALRSDVEAVRKNLEALLRERDPE